MIIPASLWDVAGDALCFKHLGSSEIHKIWPVRAQIETRPSYNHPSPWGYNFLQSQSS